MPRFSAVRPIAAEVATDCSTNDFRPKPVANAAATPTTSLRNLWYAAVMSSTLARTALETWSDVPCVLPRVAATPCAPAVKREASMPNVTISESITVPTMIS